MPSSHWSQDRYLAASRFAAAAHLGQTVPGTELPYLLHVTQVAMEVLAALQDTPGLDGDLAVQCALLHDVIEDCGVTPQALVERFGPAVAEGVLALSKDPALPTKEAQMHDSLERIRRQPPEVWMVKLADRISNLQAPPAYWDQARILRYQAEARTILDRLGEASPFLAGRLQHKIEAYSSKQP